MVVEDAGLATHHTEEYRSVGVNTAATFVIDTPFQVTAVIASDVSMPTTYTNPTVSLPDTATDVGVCEVETAEMPPNAIAILGVSY